MYFQLLMLSFSQENRSLLGVTDLDSSEWKAYTSYVDNIVLKGFCSAIRCSLQYLLDNTDASQRCTPLFEVQLLLSRSEMTFDPPLDFSYQGNFYEIVDKMVASITRMASVIPRLAKHMQLDNYQVQYALYRYTNTLLENCDCLKTTSSASTCRATLMKWGIYPSCATPFAQEHVWLLLRRASVPY